MWQAGVTIVVFIVVTATVIVVDMIGDRMATMKGMRIGERSCAGVSSRGSCGGGGGSQRVEGKGRRYCGGRRKERIVSGGGRKKAERRFFRRSRNRLNDFVMRLETGKKGC